eukprot:TRINITY_DN16325_c0_g1_i1.p1 TRINITY_DN16325_c0_g1~~TRINITY_DN16325_c0_g1_i1.p1  ORF type:complete len:357 (-),score=52.90 TRINITY_DN16325_c0_g1_i1:188-1258(-)
MDFIQTSVSYYVSTAGKFGGPARVALQKSGKQRCSTAHTAQPQRIEVVKLAQKLREIAVLEYEDALDLQQGQLEKLAAKTKTIADFQTELQHLPDEPKLLRRLDGVRAVFDSGFVEPSCSQSPVTLLRDLMGDTKNWDELIADERLRSWMLLRRCHSGVIDSDFGKVRQGIHWDELRSPTGAITRKTAWYVRAPCQCPYRYTREPVLPHFIPPWLEAVIARWLGNICGNNLPDSVNFNLYENEDQGVAWHADDEALFGGLQGDCTIVSVSLGGARRFQAARSLGNLGPRLVYDKASLCEVDLGHGDICTMEGFFQKHYIHRVPAARSHSCEPRINATFRWIKHHTGKDCPLHCEDS